VLGSLSLWLGAGASAAPLDTIDLAAVPGTGGGLLRLGGSVGSGAQGVPVAGGFDVDGDVEGNVDFAMASMRASPLGRTDAGAVYLVLGDGTIDGEIDTALSQPNVLEIYGDVVQENAGSEIWMDDVTGDGLGDLLIARQNYTPAIGREGAGALTILVGSAAVATQAAGLNALDLRAPPAELTLLTFVGANQADRLGIWMRTGDVTGDGIADIVVGADQASIVGETHRGEAYLVRGGSHLAATQTIDLASFGATALAGHIARITPPSGAAHYHLGATVQLGDLDGNGRAEVLLGAALNRAGAALPAPFPAPTPHANGGPLDGTLYIAWDGLFTGNPWTPGLTIDLGSAAGVTAINGGDDNAEFGEEILAGEDYDGDGVLDLFVGDITGSPLGRGAAGMGHVFFGAASLFGQTFDLDTPPAGVQFTTMYGAAAGDIAADTAGHGDFDGDGITDLVVAAPHNNALGRISAGVVYILLGRTTWPGLIDFETSAFPLPSEIMVIRIDGANGAGPGDQGDTLSYSAATGDVDGDGRVDLITNEMLGNGVGGQVDVGNLIVLSGAGLIAPPPTPSLPWVGYAVLGAALAVLGARQHGRGRLRSSR
jgi:hypothetical protein